MILLCTVGGKLAWSECLSFLPTVHPEGGLLPFNVAASGSIIIGCLHHRHETPKTFHSTPKTLRWHSWSDYGWVSFSSVLWEFLLFTSQARVSQNKQGRVEEVLTLPPVSPFVPFVRVFRDI